LELNKLHSLGQDRLISSSKSSPEDRQNRHQFLKFYLQSDLALLITIEYVIELMNIPIAAGSEREHRVVPMPHLPPAVMGVYNWRGEILWIVNLAKLLGLNSRSSALQMRIVRPTIVISNATATNVGDLKTIGFVVDSIAEIEWYEPHLDPNLTISNPLHSTLAPWIKSYWRSDTGEILAELDGQISIDRPELNADL
jgi:positive phototaxis protein PixI